jgi:NAD(P)-dependent dehydrogenase (short-subunit alcohol dehydrogenase family)
VAGVSGLLNLKGRTAVVTGAGSGIGRAIAVALSRRGCHLALADIDETGLARTAEQIAAQGVRLSQHRLDVSDAQATAAFPDRVVAERGGADLLVNNAGVALGGTFEQIAESDFNWLFAINFWGVVRVTRAFLPLLRLSEEACIVNMSSIFGLIAPPGQTAYAASKFAVRGFSQALRHELKGTRIGVTVVHPGGVATSIAKNARAPKGVSAGQSEHERRMIESRLKMPPEVAGEIIVRGVERRKGRVLVGSDAKMISIIERLMPVSYWKLIGWARKR